MYSIVEGKVVVNAEDLLRRISMIRVLTATTGAREADAFKAQGDAESAAASAAYTLGSLDALSAFAEALSQQAERFAANPQTRKDQSGPSVGQYL